MPFEFTGLFKAWQGHLGPSRGEDVHAGTGPLGSLCGVGLLRLEITGITEALALFRRVSLTFSGQQ